MPDVISSLLPCKGYVSIEEKELTGIEDITFEI
jgi:hypothetical protein